MPSITDLQKQVKAPGIYFGLPNNEYHEDKSISSTAMKNIGKTPLHFWTESPLNPNRVKKDKAAYKNGRALHTMFLEPEKFHDEWSVKAGCKTTTLPETITADQYAIIKKAYQNIQKDEYVWSFFQYGFSEVSIFWIDEETGVPCRIRPDRLSYICADLKSCADITDNGLHKAILNFAYYRAAAFYLEGLAQIKKALERKEAQIYNCPDNAMLARILEREHKKFVFVFQEMEEPLAYRAEELCEAYLEVGRDSFRYILHKFKHNYELYGDDAWPSGFERKSGVLSWDDAPPFKNYIFPKE